MASPKISLLQGRNVWRLWRTDRDGASQAQVIETVGPAVRRMLRAADMSDPWEIWRTDGGKGNPTWRIGAARPVELTAMKRYGVGVAATGPSMGVPRGSRVLATRNKYPGKGIPTVRGKAPWWIVVDLWWRKPDTSLPWPGFRVDWGIRTDTVHDADWVLERAVHVPAKRETKPDPGDETAAETHSTHAAEAMRIALPPLAIALVAAAILYADSKRLL